MSNVLELKKKNEEIAEKFSQIEEKLLSAANPAGLFEEWLTGMADAFGIPFLWISIMVGPENSPLIKALRTSSVLKDRVSVIDGDTFTGLTPQGAVPVLANTELKPYFRLLPKDKYFIKSIAVAPISLNGRIIGSLNHGDSSPNRYEPSMDTSLLQSLAARMSSCLSAMMTGA